MTDPMNVIATLFIATFIVTAVFWLALWASGQANVNVGTEAPNEETAIE